MFVYILWCMQYVRLDMANATENPANTMPYTTWLCLLVVSPLIGSASYDSSMWWWWWWWWWWCVCVCVVVVVVVVGVLCWKYQRITSTTDQVIEAGCMFIKNVIKFNRGYTWQNMSYSVSNSFVGAWSCRFLGKMSVRLENTGPEYLVKCATINVARTI